MYEMNPPPNSYDLMLTDKLLDELTETRPTEVKILREALIEVNEPHDCNELADDTDCDENHCSDENCVDADDVDRFVDEVEDTLRLIGEHYKLDISQLDTLDSYDLVPYRFFLRDFTKQLKEKLNGKGTVVQPDG